MVSIIPLNPAFKEEKIETNAFSDDDADDDEVIRIFAIKFLGTDEEEDGAEEEVEELGKEVEEVEEGGAGLGAAVDIFPTVSCAIIASAQDGLITKLGSSSEKEKRYSCIERMICSCLYIRIND